MQYILPFKGDTWDHPRGPYGLAARLEVFLSTKSRALPWTGHTKVRYVRTHSDFVRPENNFREVQNHDSTFMRTSLSGTQVTESENHPGWRRRTQGRFQGDMGGAFKTTKIEATTVNSGPVQLYHRVRSMPTIQFPGGSVEDEYRYTGPLLPCSPDVMKFPVVTPSSNQQLDVWGAKAIAQVSPSNSAVDLTVTIGELVKEGIPKLIGSSVGALRGMTNRERRKAIGGEYLNVVFGWKPLVDELLDFANTIHNSENLIRQFERDSGRLVRRTFGFPPEITTKIVPVGGLSSPWTHAGFSAFNDFPNLNSGQVYRTEVSTTWRWFSGAFTYYVPPEDSLRNSMARDVIFARRLLGISLTPDAIWNLTPWTWMFDWFFNAGDVISSWGDWAINNQVLAYGYMMETKKVSHTYTFTGRTGLRPPSTRPFDVTLTTETKVRRKATPYGFGLDWNGFSPSQLAILAALGLTKS